MPAPTLEFPVWQFVRLMVELEQRPQSKALSTWRDIWTKIDRELARMAEEDAPQFSELMMDTTVTLEGVTVELNREIIQALRIVADKIGRTMRAPDLDDQSREDLTFEHQELKARIKDLAG